MLYNCNNTIPRSEQFLEGLSATERYLIIVCAVLCFIAVVILIDNIIFIWRKHSRLRAAVITSTWLVAMCPTLAVVALTAMLVPNAFLFRDVTVSVSQSVIMYKFVQLLGTYANIFTGIRERILAERIQFNVRPLCCCLPCLPTACTCRRTINILKFLVLQYPVLMVVLTNVIMMTWLDGKYIPGSWVPTNLYPYLSAMRVVSVLTAIYALNILVNLCMKAMRSLYVKQKFNALSLCLVFFSIQGPTFDIMAANGVFDFREGFSSRIMANFYENMVFCVEMFTLTLFNLWSYRRPLGPPVNMTELEKSSLHEAPTDNILTSPNETKPHIFTKHFHQLRIPNSTGPKENDAVVDQSSSSTPKASSRASLIQKTETVAISWLPTITQSWNMGIDRGTTHLQHTDLTVRGQREVQNGIQYKMFELAHEQQGRNGCYSDHTAEVCSLDVGL